ncbi:MAG: bifunctional 4-hydroxy-2-oxoglutarate aldolase/2-dehydro-3-deoxy-phosphogluconate aldolase [Bacteroidia bacterium]|nr:bifunctional 4-hydroxy-2-oxoglutarate aldolase/2-dehydro-3-deoxy-phosphogluconate aldolase [Bacteroidia bacterium]
MEEMIQVIAQNRIIVIVRKLYGDPLFRLAEALYAGGLRLMEVTFDQSDPDHLEKTCGAIEALSTRFAGRMHIGAGTVLTPKQVKVAFEAGAEYIISPDTNIGVIEYTKSLGLVSIPGAMTPTEIVRAHDAGADFVKVFPASFLGTKFIRDVQGPLGHIKCLATGGIGEQNFLEYMRAGYAGAGMGGVLVDKEVIESENWLEFTRRAQSLTAMVEQLNGELK